MYFAQTVDTLSVDQSHNNCLYRGQSYLVAIGDGGGLFQLVGQQSEPTQLCQWADFSVTHTVCKQCYTWILILHAYKLARGHDKSVR